MAEPQLDLSVAPGDEDQNPPCYLCAGRWGRAGALARVRGRGAPARAPRQGWRGRRTPPGTVRVRLNFTDVAEQQAHG
jgi:hypothetical protein